jgi:hypothetical protein
MTNTTWLYTDGDEPAITIEQQKVDTLVYRGLTVLVWKAIPGQAGTLNSSSFVRHEDLPADLAETFYQWQFSTQLPFRDAAYAHDFAHFMGHGGRGYMGDLSEIVGRHR